MEVLLIGSVFLVLMILGVPIGTSLGVAGVVTIYQFDLGIEMLGVNFASGIASFPLLAIPFFVLAGVILDRAGLAATIARFFELLVGESTGGLAMVAVAFRLRPGHDGRCRHDPAGAHDQARIQ